MCVTFDDHYIFKQEASAVMFHMWPPDWMGIPDPATRKPHQFYLIHSPEPATHHSLR